MPIHIISVGKLKEAHYDAAVQEYVKRLVRYCKLSQTEVMDERDPGELSPALMEKAMAKEGARILERIGATDYVVALTPAGERMDSETFCARLTGWHDNSLSICFVIGGSLGLSKEVLDRANLKLSLSDMTFPHQLARVILLEQIYRAYKIKAGERYHK